jgi:hypothetical protein
MVMQGRRADAEALFERLLSVSNDVGLLAEEYDLSKRRLCGNFPQALSHLALVTTALGLSGPVLQRSGGNPFLLPCVEACVVSAETGQPVG